MSSQIPDFEYTLKMETIYNDSVSELKSFYCREDFEAAIRAYNQSAPDAKMFRKKDLVNLCRARKIDPKQLQFDPKSVLEQVPTRDELKEKLLEFFYHLYKETPSTTDYMERIVRRLAPEYSEDTVRTAILKQFIQGSDESFKRFDMKSIWRWAENRFDEYETERFDRVSPEIKKEMILAKIDDSIFAQDKAELNIVDNWNLLSTCIRKYQADSTLDFISTELSEKAEAELNLFLQENSLRIDAVTDDKIHAVAAALSDGTVSEQLPSVTGLFTIVENDFKAQLDTIRRKNKKGVQGTLKELYKQSRKDLVKAKRTTLAKTNPDPELLFDVCEDLASGHFRANGKTRRYLYYFAFMFGMTIPMDDMPDDPDRDVVKNLFHDYYNDNLIRLLAEEYTDIKTAKTFEHEPTGEGINYKNYVESIYVYFLCHTEQNVLPGMKIDTAEEIIGKCIDLARQNRECKEDFGTAKETDYTYMYKKHFMNILLNLDVDALPEYILKNYVVISPRNEGAPQITVSSEEKKASDLIDEMMEELDDLYAVPLLGTLDGRKLMTIDQDGKKRTEEEIKKDKEEIRAERKRKREDLLCARRSLFDWKLSNLLREKYFTDTDFLKVISVIDKRLKTKIIRYSKNEIDRMLIILHILFNESSENTCLSAYKIRSKMKDKNIELLEYDLSSAIKGLLNAGFDIGRKKTAYYLGKREYQEDALNELLEFAASKNYIPDEIEEWILSDLLLSKAKSEERITRSEFIVLHLSKYIADLDLPETEGEGGIKSVKKGKQEKGPQLTFPKVYKNYLHEINPFLEEARFQAISEKNIFDMFVVISLYFYLLECR